MCRRKASLFGVPFPLFVYSFSSKGFIDLEKLVSFSLDMATDAFLISLYDYRYLLGNCNLTDSDDPRIRVWDSGGYETALDDDLSSYFSAIPQTQIWEPEQYVEIAKTVPWNSRDVLVSFDSFVDRTSMAITQQMDTAIELFERIPGRYARDLILHVDHTVSARSIVVEV